MKILYLTPGIFDKGGISRYNRYQISALRDIAGAENVRAISLLGPHDSQVRLRNVFHVDWHSGQVDVNFRMKARFVVHAFRLASQFKPDLIWSGHLHYSGLMVPLEALTRATTVVQHYGHKIWTPRPGRPDIRWGLRRMDYMVSDCNFTAEYICQNLLRGGSACHVGLRGCGDDDARNAGKSCTAALWHPGSRDAFCRPHPG